jgi:PAS domain S-box-containing protein
MGAFETERRRDILFHTPGNSIGAVMTERIGIILLEDSRPDADIIQHQLRNTHPGAEFKWVQTEEQYVEALASFKADIIISDHSLPGFTSVEAFKLLKDSGIDIPFVLVTATVSEEFAVTMMREGVADYLLKDRLQRLPLAITNALEKWQAEREKKESINLLFQNEKRFRSMIENSHDVIGVTDENLKAVYLSPTYTRITGRTFAERSVKGGVSFIHPEDREEYMSTINKVKASPGRHFSMLYRMLHKNGNYIWMEGTVINMLSDEAIGGILFNLRDVTARKEAEESLQKSRANLTAIIENSNVSIYSIDRQFKYISFNSFMKNSLKLYGLDIQVGDSVFDFLTAFDPSELGDWESKYIKAFAGERVEFEKEFHIADVYACLTFSINPIIEGHYVSGLSCFAWDITEQKRASQAVKQSEARFRALIENNFDSIVMRDANQKMIYASPSVERLIGYTVSELTSDAINLHVHPDDDSAVRASYEKMLHHPGVPFPITMRMKTKSGNYVWTEGVVTNMLENRDVKGIVSNFRDITERKEGELQREKITYDLVERNKNLEQYAYIVSHNLRGPVANILGVSILLEMDQISSEDREQSLGYLFDSARRLDDVIKDLNMILQMRQNINEQTEDVSLAEIVKDVELSITDLVKRNRVSITTDFNEVKSITTLKSYLYSIFYNLITNSIKYKQDGIDPVINISSLKTDDHVLIKFSDNGLGIDLQTHGSKLFGLYKRFHPEHAEGKGVGLFMTKTQVEALGGKVSVKSEVNIGTEFVIEL